MFRFTIRELILLTVIVASRGNEVENRCGRLWQALAEILAARHRPASFTLTPLATWRDAPLGCGLLGRPIVTRRCFPRFAIIVHARAVARGSASTIPECVSASARC
jgi:hypothetical protein